MHVSFVACQWRSVIWWRSPSLSETRCKGSRKSSTASGKFRNSPITEQGNCLKGLQPPDSFDQRECWKQAQFYLHERRSWRLRSHDSQVRGCDVAPDSADWSLDARNEPCNSASQIEDRNIETRERVEHCQLKAKDASYDLLTTLKKNKKSPNHQ